MPSLGRTDGVATHRYGRVATATVVVVVATIALPDDDVGRGVALMLQAFLLTMVTIAARDASGRALTAIALAAAVLGAVGAVGADLPTWLVLGLSGALAGAMVATMATGVVALVRSEGVTVHAVGGGLGIYLLVGMLFADVVGAVAAVGDNSYFAQGTDATSGERIYYSFTTLTTTGFGDLTPGTEVGRALGVLEMLTGQIYLVVVVALLVGNLRRRVA
ncbi:ion channel [Baekduia sp. Peel2402]|uniref:ion channel n=1 Tax=Baekduia sp. Peel2402 TaxID=3458296 RepID=UPI00403E96E4